MFADPKRGFAPAPPVGSHGTVVADPSRGFAPAPPVGNLGTVFANLNLTGASSKIPVNESSVFYQKSVRRKF